MKRKNDTLIEINNMIDDLINDNTESTDLNIVISGKFYDYEETVLLSKKIMNILDKLHSMDIISETVYNEYNTRIKILAGNLIFGNTAIPDPRLFLYKEYSQEQIAVLYDIIANGNISIDEIKEYNQPDVYSCYQLLDVKKDKLKSKILSI